MKAVTPTRPAFTARTCVSSVLRRIGNGPPYIGRTGPEAYEGGTPCGAILREVLKADRVQEESE
jgi:hypothetical protein